MENTEDITIKYQRLGQEYQKARAQITVLKKAVIDEQAASKATQEILKQRDQEIRKFQQDIDSLEFRNSQLSKRVEILQNELDSYEKKGSKKQSSQTKNVIHEQELQMKIKENERLHKELQNFKEENLLNIQLLESKLEILEQEKQVYDKTIADLNLKNNYAVDHLKGELNCLQESLKKRDEDLNLANITAEKYKLQLNSIHQELRCKLEKSTNLIKEKIPFSDYDNIYFNEFNIPACDREHQHAVQNILDVLTSHLIIFMAALSDYHTYLEQRLRVCSMDIKQEDVNSINMKFCDHLLNNAKHSRKVQQALRNLKEQSQNETFLSLETLSSYKEFSTSFKFYVNYLEVLLPYRILSLEDESQASVWSDTLEKCNLSIIANEKKVVVLFKKLLSYISLLATTNVTSSSLTLCSNTFCQVMQDLHTVFKSLHSSHLKKCGEEHELPFYTERLKSTDKCFISALSSLESICAKIQKVFNSNIDFLSTIHGFRRKGMPEDGTQSLAPCLQTFYKKASSYMEFVKKVPTSSIPYTVAVNNYKSFVMSTTSSHTYKEQAANSQETIVRLEQEKEKWLIEAQLLKAKYDKEIKKTLLLTEELQKCKTESLSRNEEAGSMLRNEENFISTGHSDWRGSMRSTSSVSSSSDLPAVLTKVGTVEILNKDHVSSESENEVLLKNHMTNRIAQLTKQLQITDSKCIDFFHEAHSMYKQLVLADLNKQKLSNNILESNKRIEELQDELETTKRSYEEQMRTLTDHLCGMNEKLTLQKDEIDNLKSGALLDKKNKSKWKN
ncbi:protein phosphatase 1 regulatory subunit 21 isoform X2 [Hydra vulgaris]|uniref:protein phosphatase 1 regulatory subunit 21 isoform X2 n=1 Tax=Hydra vulgaris TaxID=6087 RepID=UPI001F5F6C03|nr:protein phosphatase 1 regulatory subunit 21 isoform X2 [Hydra vulgaris]